VPANIPIADILIGWYDLHRRDLPWRHHAHDPYRVWLSEIMLQQTTVAAVTPYFEHFIARWPTVAAFAMAEDEDVMQAWAGLGYYARARNMLSCARTIVADHGGRFPDTEAGLRALPGIGLYTAAAIAAIAFARRAVVVDGNIERVVARLFAVETPLPSAKRALYALTDSLTPDSRAGDFAQGMMDLGSTICTPRSPSCLICPLQRECRAAANHPASYPRRRPKAPRVAREATSWWIENGDAVLLVRRPATGLLGGMLGFPSTLGSDTWRPENEGPMLGSVTHEFTHFALVLNIRAATIDKGCNLPPDSQWCAKGRLSEVGLPGVFLKVARAIGETHRR
jgi:A/G-specific adenine glycosylase